MTPEDPKFRDLTLSAAIRLLRELAFLSVLGYLSVKLFSGELSLDFAKLSATELVNLLLAFFSIALSAAFYFAATSQSNQFYDNVNKFSKDTSELLGRLDEQVKGIGGRQTELRDSIDKYYHRDRAGQVDRAQVEVQEKAKQLEENFSKVVSGLMERANLPEPERAKIREEIKSKDAALNELRERLGRITSDQEGAVRRYTQRRIREFGVEKALGMPIEEWAVPVISSGVIAYRRDLKSLGFIKTATINSFDEVTESGRAFLSAALEAVRERKDA